MTGKSMQAITFDIKPVRWLLCKAGGYVSPTAYWSGLSGVRLNEVSEPTLPGAGWVRLRTILGGICGTDMALIRQRSHPASILQCFTSFPAVLGHENVAVVDEVAADVVDWKRGDRVVVEPSLSCVTRGFGGGSDDGDICPSCKAGRPALCERFADAGHLPAGMMIGYNSKTCGSWGSSFVAHQSQLHRVPDGVSDEEAVLTDPIACSMHGVLRAIPEPGQRVLVLGGGIIGLGVVMALRSLGLDNQVTCVVRGETQAKRFESYGADQTLRVPRKSSIAKRLLTVADAFGTSVTRSGWGPGILQHGPDVVYDCVGNGASLTEAMRYCCPRGTVVALGTAQFCWMDVTPMWFRELTILGAHGRQVEQYGNRRLHTYDLVMELAAEERLKLDGLLSHVFDLDQYREAFETICGRRREDVTKAAFRHV